MWFTQNIFVLLKYGFRKNLLRYKWTSDHLNTFSLLFFQISADLEKKWGKKCSTGQKLISTEVTSYKNPYFSSKVKNHISVKKLCTYFIDSIYSFEKMFQVHP